MESTNEIVSIFWMGTLIMVFLSMVLLFLVVFYQRYLAKMKQREAELLLEKSLESEKKERQRIAKDLHDSVQSDLVAIRNYFLVLSRNFVHPDSGDLVSTIENAMEQTIKNTRLISHKLMPPLLEKAGFEIAVEEYFQTLTKSTQKKFIFESTINETIIPTEIAYELFRVLQEFTTNMLKYGSITICQLNLSETKDGIQLEIIDDGVKFDFRKNYLLSKGSGLFNIQSRLSSLKATLNQQETKLGNHFLIKIHVKK